MTVTGPPPKLLGRAGLGVGRLKTGTGVQIWKKNKKFNLDTYFEKNIGIKSNRLGHKSWDPLHISQIVSEKKSNFSICFDFGKNKLCVGADSRNLKN